MSTHTPGPWEIESGHIQNGGIAYWQITDGADAICCNQFCYADNSDANARLIVAAPELLSALAPFVAFFEHALRWHTPDYEHRSDPDKVVCGWNGAQLTMRDFGNARAALAKAENG